MAAYGKHVDRKLDSTKASFHKDESIKTKIGRRLLAWKNIVEKTRRTCGCSHQTECPIREEAKHFNKHNKHQMHNFLLWQKNQHDHVKACMT
jgi:hypothetical protein